MQSTSSLQRSLAPRSLAFSHKTLTTTLQPGPSSAHGPVPWCGPHLSVPSCLAVNDQLRERQPYLSTWARSSFEQGALCALAALSSRRARYVAIPGDACFQCHGLGPCVASPPQAVLPLVIHYYGNKDAIHELDHITAMPYLVQSLFGHGELPPFWCLHEWKAAADFAVACKHRPALLWSPQVWTDTSLPLSSDGTASPHAILAVPSCIADGLRAMPTDEQPTRLPTATGGQVVHVYGTGLNGGQPQDIPVDQTQVTFHLRGAYGPSMSQMFADQYCGENGWRRLPRAPLRSHAEYLEFCRCLLDEAGHQR